jgi:SPP1 gp7 family putative phage head morphogenesis protein
VFRDIVPPGTLAADLYRAGYFPAIELTRRTADRLAAEYARSLDALTRDAPSDLNRELETAEQELTRLALLLRPAMRSWTLAVERWHRGRWRGAALAASGVDLSTLLGPEDVASTLETVLERNIGLVKDVAAQARQRMATAVYDGLRTRAPARDVAKQLREAADLGKARSVRIASDQLTKVTSALASERRQQAGVDEWEWVHSRKAHPREDHQARNGKVYSDANAPADLPGRLPFCGCRERAVLRFD